MIVRNMCFSVSSLWRVDIRLILNPGVIPGQGRMMYQDGGYKCAVVVVWVEMNAQKKRTPVAEALMVI